MRTQSWENEVKFSSKSGIDEADHRGENAKVRKWDHIFKQVRYWWCRPSWWERKGPQGVLWDEAQNENAVLETPSIGLWRSSKSYGCYDIDMHVKFERRKAMHPVTNWSTYLKLKTGFERISHMRPISIKFMRRGFGPRNGMMGHPTGYDGVVKTFKL